MKGVLIAIEGIDGSGKSTLVKYLKEVLEEDKLKVVSVATREEDKENIFSSVIEGYELDPQSQSYMFYFQLLHSYKVDRVIKALKEGKIVISDRWDLSFYVYHENFGFFVSETKELRDDVSRLAFKGVRPHLGIYLDTDVDIAIDRRLWRGEKIEDIQYQKNFYTIITSGYKSLAQRYEWVVINANDAFETVRKTVLDHVQILLKKHRKTNNP